MRALVPSETALVLGGGGAKGAYEVGAIAALDELGIKAGSVFGTSVGALHAAMYAQGSMDAAAALWDNIRLSDVVSEESLAIADDAENIFDHPEKLLEFITRYAQKKSTKTKSAAAACIWGSSPRAFRRWRWWKSGLRRWKPAL